MKEISVLEGLQQSCSNEYDDDIQSKINELEQIYQEKAEGAIIRARVNWSEKGEKSNTYFYNLESKSRSKKSIKTLITDDGLELTDGNRVCKEAFQLYSNLYSAKISPSTEDIQTLFNAEIPKLDEDDKVLLNTPLAEKDFKIALDKMKSNKSPGSDGFTTEFYKFFWNDLKKFFLKSVNKSIFEKELSYSQRRGLITLIEKQGKDARYISNWRPITLLNVDYKILAKIST